VSAAAWHAIGDAMPSSRKVPSLPPFVCFACFVVNPRSPSAPSVQSVVKLRGLGSDPRSIITADYADIADTGTNQPRGRAFAHEYTQILTNGLQLSAFQFSAFDLVAASVSEWTWKLASARSGVPVVLETRRPRRVFGIGTRRGCRVSMRDADQESVRRRLA